MTTEQNKIIFDKNYSYFSGYIPKTFSKIIDIYTLPCGYTVVPFIGYIGTKIYGSNPARYTYKIGLGSQVVPLTLQFLAFVADCMIVNPQEYKLAAYWFSKYRYKDIPINDFDYSQTYNTITKQFPATEQRLYVGSVLEDVFNQLGLNIVYGFRNYDWTGQVSVSEQGKNYLLEEPYKRLQFVNSYIENLLNRSIKTNLEKIKFGMSIVDGPYLGEFYTYLPQITFTSQDYWAEINNALRESYIDVHKNSVLNNIVPPTEYPPKTIWFENPPGYDMPGRRLTGEFTGERLTGIDPQELVKIYSNKMGVSESDIYALSALLYGQQRAGEVIPELQSQINAIESTLQTEQNANTRSLIELQSDFEGRAESIDREIREQTLSFEILKNQYNEVMNAD